MRVLSSSLTLLDCSRVDPYVSNVLEEIKSIYSENFGLNKSEIKHNVTHSIKAKRSPVVSEIRRFSPNKLKIPKIESEFILEHDICRPSISSGSNLMHIVKKKTILAGIIKIIRPLMQVHKLIGIPYLIYQILFIN
ncbi:hypothetical protein CEXT_217191 [Caerostris extrusa]|uniref:Uncharacterized protein n=1 Tax=Caerostris extrusa TaxID=172846 RepID=A0AAV4UF85_CAEEX|nr:hypothetical protein CEXT_217191 [Caerostris extrusa]